MFYSGVFIECWPKFKDIFQKMFDEFNTNGRLNVCIKENFICLIPMKTPYMSKNLDL